MMETLRNRIDLVNIPFTDRGSRLMLFRHEHKFLIRLAERWVKWEAEMGHYRQRPPILRDLVFLNAEGTPLTDISLDTYPHVAHVQTPVGLFGWIFIDMDTLLLRLPPGYYGLEFTAYGEQSHKDLRGGTLHGKRNIAYTTNARLIENTVERIDEHQYRVRLMLRADPGDALMLNITPRKAFNRSIPDPDTAEAQADAIWQAWFDATPPVLEKYQAQYDYAWWIMRAGLISTRYYFTREALLPSKIHYVGVWHWDQVFHAIAYRHVDTKLAEDQLRIILDHQRDDGMLPDAIHDEGMVDRLLRPVEADVTKPPIMSWGALKLFETSHHRDFLEEIYEPLARWNYWWMKGNCNESGLCEYRHPFSSGLDDNPLWDVGMPVTAPDLNTYLVIQCDSLAHIARLIGDEDNAQHYSHMSQTLLKDMITHMWDEDAGVFRALHKGQHIPTLTPFNLLPLLTGKLPQDITERLIENLMNPALFWTPYPLSTVAVADENFDPLQMWRGPVWININYFFVDALQRNGRHDLAAELRRKTLDLIMKHKDIYEYYHPITGERPPKSAPMFGWSAALFIELALDETRAMAESEAISTTVS